MSEARPDDGKLYAKSVAAAKRYFAPEKPATDRLSKAFEVARKELYRAGWMTGYRAGLRAKR